MTPVDTLNLEQEARQVGEQALAVVRRGESLQVVDLLSAWRRQN
jgi:hypothetical protein